MATTELPNDATNLGGAREVDATDLWCGNQGFNDLCCILWSVCDNIHNSVRQPGFHKRSTNEEMESGASLRRLEYHRITASQCHRDGAGT
ncbi:hypothetical protein D9M72_616400 [compost metagenome]